ncbi:hypothetical protein TSUD_87560, partial [Trifolium subterraneum]
NKVMGISIVSAMGVCLRNHIKAESPINSVSGLSSKSVNASAENISSPGCKVPDDLSSSIFKGWIDENSTSAAKPGKGIAVAVKRLYQDGFKRHKDLLVAFGAAKGLAFLHSGETKATYCDFKTSNVLLDSNYNAKLSNFGLAKGGGTAVDKNRLTYGYTAPEYLATGQYELEDVYKVAILSLRCLSIEAKLRPKMDEVVTNLEQLQVPDVNGCNQNRLRRRSADDVPRVRTAAAYPLRSTST